MVIDIKDIKIKPYVRMTQRGKWVNKQAQQYLNSKSTLMTLIRNQMQQKDYEMMPAQTPLSVSITVHTHTSQGHRADLDNIVKAILDACQGIAFKDDRWIDQIEATREIGKREALYIGISEL